MSENIQTQVTKQGVTIRAAWRKIDGRYEPAELAFSADTGAFLSSHLIRQLPIGTALSEMRQQVRDATGGKVPDKRIRGRRGPQRGASLTQQQLEDVAAVYRDAFVLGRSVTAAVADAFGVAPHTASKRIMLARSAGLLADIPVERGRRRAIGMTSAAEMQS